MSKPVKKTGPKSKKAAGKNPPATIVHNPFPCHVTSREFTDMDFNDRLRNGIWRQRALDPNGLTRSNVSGTWHSQDNIFTQLGEDGQTLKDMFAKAMMQWGSLIGLKPDASVNMKMQAWAMVYSDRGYATVHTHPNCHVSGVYYVDDTTDDTNLTMATGAKLEAGSIEFVNPIPNGHQSSLMHLNPSFSQPFKRGLMLIFPSALAHFVHPLVTEKGERISVACNASFYPSKETS